MEIEYSTKEQCVMVFERQQKRKWQLKQTDAKYRRNKLKALHNAILKSAENIKDALRSDLGKPATETILTELYPVIAEIKHGIEHLDGWMRPRKVKPSLPFFGSNSRILCEPKGVALIISPWNYPFQLAAGPLVSAIAAGNCAILKPSEFSLSTSRCIAEIIGSVFEEDEVAVMQGDHTTAQTLLSLPFDHIFFTGSTNVGKSVMEAAAKHLSSVTLELGGKSPVIVDRSADLRETARKVIWGKLTNAGQICVSPDYLLIPEDMASSFVELAKEAVSAYYGRVDSIQLNRDYCRIVSDSHGARIRSLVKSAIALGAKPVLGLGALSGEADDARCIPPTILTDVSLDSPIMQEEIFGPVLPVIGYKNLDDAIGIIASMPHPLALYIFARNSNTVEYVLMRTFSGDALINDVVIHFANTGLPFGGIGPSGFGKSHGHAGFMAFSHERSVMRQSKLGSTRLFYPPYTDRVKRLAEFTLKHL